MESISNLEFAVSLTLIFAFAFAFGIKFPYASFLNQTSFHKSQGHLDTL